MTILKPCWLN